MIATVEEAYEAIGRYLTSFVGTRTWDSAVCRMQIYADMAKGTQWLNSAGKSDETGGFEANPNAIWEGLDAAIFLRDALLKKTGQRIWGLTFILYPNGKFNMDFDYNKPSEYEETDDKINVSPVEFTEKIHKKS